MKTEEQKLKSFMDWTTKEGKNYPSRTEFDMRKGLWQQTDDMIEEHNKKSLASGRSDPLILGHNAVSDMT